MRARLPKPDVGFELVDGAACDLLLGRCPLRSALAQLLSAARPARAQAVLLVGRDAPPRHAPALLAALRAETGATTIAQLDVPDPGVRPWLVTLSSALAEGSPLDAPIVEASCRLDLPPAVFLGEGGATATLAAEPIGARPIAASPGASGPAFAYYPRLQRLLAHVEAFFASEIAVRDAARVVSLEEKYFSAYFHAKTGVCFRDWLTGFRVSRAVEMMRGRDDSITTIAFAVGFNDLRTFERAFKKHTHLTPRAFRQSLRPAP